MSEALDMAARGRGRTSPNPMVGAVVVRDGAVVGRGFHPRAGEPHAEVFALREAGALARGATLLVTLEPCSHVGRTPPCAPAVIEAGIATVYAAMEDPNPLVAGRGLQLLSDAGVEVHVGLMEREARRLNEAFVKRVTTGLPFVEIKVALTLDGKIATSSGRSRWITGEPAREWVQRRRDAADAILVGAETARLDNPRLTVRLPNHDGRQPLRCVVTASGRLDPSLGLFTDGAGDTVVFCPEGTAVPGQAVPLPVGPDGLDLDAALIWLANRGCNDVLVEGGGQLNAGLLRASLVDRLSVFISPKVFGGDAPGGFGELGVNDPAQALKLHDLEVTCVGDDWLFQGRPC
ncbi:MAG: bifunctional diaminohydroxyphosphoribosylaminopyrimidine deaminase/5-amino-6-(5-phosphoribosylamino)uracil reductase RibD [Chloroflexi bacterium]|nr:bifunctional diaminohydroxyphosphoribosylaminopyrimidine deaminase/5-amino-6-(5-phosphoribosylamino)uracil reductase RibD [Chloroflexota bacterium]